MMMFNRKEYSKRWQKDNPEKAKENCRRYREKNREKIKERGRLYYKNNPEKMKEKRRKYRETHKYKYGLEYFKLWRENNPGYNKQYRKDNLEKMKIRLNRWQKNKRKTDLKFNLSRRMSCMVNLCLKKCKDNKHWKSLVGYTIIELIHHLNKTMPEKYTWQDFLDGKLHIDHIIPISAHNFTKPEHIDFRKCWALKNLQLLPAKENRIKHDRLFKPFQPSLKLNLEVLNEE